MKITQTQTKKVTRRVMRRDLKDHLMCSCLAKIIKMWFFFFYHWNSTLFFLYQLLRASWFNERYFISSTIEISTIEQKPRVSFNDWIRKKRLSAHSDRDREHCCRINAKCFGSYSQTALQWARDLHSTIYFYSMHCKW